MSTRVAIDVSEERIVSQRWDAIYAFTTENQTGYLQTQQGSALCIAGSGDHIINLSLKGATTIYAFDCNPKALFWSEVKIAALNKLSFAEYKSFFLRGSQGKRNSNALDIKVYERFCRDLSRPTRNFIESLYSSVGGKGATIRESAVFNNLYDSDTLKIASNPYLKNGRAFLKAKQQLGRTQVTLLQRDASRLERFPLTFDCICLSNLADYSELLFGGRTSLLRFAKSIVFPLATRLSKSGKLYAAYIYGSDSNVPRRSQIDDPCLRAEIFRDRNFLYAEAKFNGVKAYSKDSVVILTKKFGVH